jgi:hypothetical protein
MRWHTRTQLSPPHLLRFTHRLVSRPSDARHTCHSRPALHCLRLGDSPPHRNPPRPSQLLTAPHSARMAARVPSGAKSELVKAPGELVVSGYVTCPDVTKVLTPDLKLAELGAHSTLTP